MKCQRCDRDATFHITELTGGKPQELHLCQEHAQEYLSPANEPAGEPQSLASAIGQQLAVGQTAEQLARLDKESCPVCGITFYDFRNQGRLGCAHDYERFAKQLEPLIVNIHGETTHVGKRPQREPADTSGLTDLIRMRNEMKAAVSAEKYELASEIRDQIRAIESSIGR